MQNQPNEAKYKTGDSDASAQDALSQWVTFVLAGERYGIDVMQVQEVLRLSEITPVPGAPHYVIGIINLRGNVVTVVDTRCLFSLMTTEADDASRIIIVEVSGQVVGILVDSVAQVIEVPQSRIESVPKVGNNEHNRYIQGIYSEDDDLFTLINLEKLLSDTELGGGDLF